MHAVNTAFAGLCVANPRKSELCKHLLISLSMELAPRSEALSFSLLLCSFANALKDVGNCSPFKSSFNFHQAISKARPNIARNKVSKE